MQVESLLALGPDVDIADADSRRPTRLPDERPGAFWVGRCAAVAWPSAPESSPPGFDGNAAVVSQSGQCGDAAGQILRRRLRIGEHHQVKARRDRRANPIIAKGIR